MWIYIYIFFIYSSVDGHLVGFSILAIMNISAMCMDIQTSCGMLSGLYIHTEVVLFGHIVVLVVFEVPPAFFHSGFITVLYLFLTNNI